MTAPSIRSSVCKSILEQVDGLSEEKAREIRRFYGEERLAELQSAGPFAWLDWEHVGVLSDGVAAMLHDEESLRFWREFALKSMQQSAFKAIVETAFRLMGRTPAALIHYWHLGYKVAAKNHGLMSAEVEGEGAALLSLRDVPLVVLRGSYVHSHCGSLVAACATLGLEGRTRVVRYDREAGVLDVRISWTPGDARESAPS